MPYIKRTISHNESDNPTQEISKEYTSIKHPTLLQDLYGFSDPAVRRPNVLSLLAATGLAIPISLSWSFAKPTGKRVRIGGSTSFRSLLPACGRCGHIFTARAMSAWSLCILDGEAKHQRYSLGDRMKLPCLQRLQLECTRHGSTCLAYWMWLQHYCQAVPYHSKVFLAYRP